MVEITELMNVEMKIFAEARSEEIIETCYVTGGINFSKRDYELLVLNDRAAHAPTSLTLHQYMSFTDVNLCKDKMIASVSWHPCLTGIVAIAYSEFNISDYKKRSSYDDTKTITYNKNPVLIWSYVDQLKPKLVLEAHREVTSIEYCPYDPSVVVGGCRNGQIIIWDLTGKLERVEAEELLTPSQQTYRIIMNSMMTWMKNIRNVAFIPLSAASDLQYSHDSTITEIMWFPPFYSINKLGRFVKMEDNEYSYTFASSSLDGTVRFWVLNHKQLVGTGEVTMKYNIFYHIYNSTSNKINKIC